MTDGIKGIRIRETQKLSPGKVLIIWEIGRVIVRKKKWENSETVLLTSWVTFKYYLTSHGLSFLICTMIGFGYMLSQFLSRTSIGSSVTGRRGIRVTSVLSHLEKKNF